MTLQLQQKRHLASHALVHDILWLAWEASVDLYQSAANNNRKGKQQIHKQKLNILYLTNRKAYSTFNKEMNNGLKTVKEEQGFLVTKRKLKIYVHLNHQVELANVFLLWVWKIVVDFFVKYVENHIQKVPEEQQPISQTKWRS